MTKLGLLINTPHTIAGEAERAIRARMWNSDRRCGIGGYSITADHISQMKDVLGESFEPVLRACGFQPMLTGEWQTRFRTEAGGEAYIYLTPRMDLLRAIVQAFPR